MKNNTEEGRNEMLKKQKAEEDGDYFSLLFCLYFSLEVLKVANNFWSIHLDKDLISICYLSPPLLLYLFRSFISFRSCWNRRQQGSLSACVCVLEEQMKRRIRSKNTHTHTHYCGALRRSRLARLHQQSECVLACVSQTQSGLPVRNGVKLRVWHESRAEVKSANKLLVGKQLWRQSTRLC